MNPSCPSRRFVIVVRADPVICGHSGEARNLAEVALRRGFDDVRIVTWPIETLQTSGLPLKPLDAVMPYSDGITVERPDPVGDYKVPDGRTTSGMVGRLVELFTDGVPTVCLSLYLTPHTTVVAEALAVARSTGLPVRVTTLAEAVGSDITNVVRSCVEQGRFGPAAHVLSSYLAQDHCLAVSEYTKTLIVDAAEAIDERHGTTFGPQCRDRVRISYPAIDTSLYTDLDPAEVEQVLEHRNLVPDRYVLFLSRLSAAKGVDDLIEGFARSTASKDFSLVIAGSGPEAAALRDQAVHTSVGRQIMFLDDVGDDEKRFLMAGSAAYCLPSKPRPEFVETFGIALVEKMLAGGGPVLTTETGGIPEAVGDTATTIPPASPEAIAHALDEVLLHITEAETDARADKARTFALQFDRFSVFDKMFSEVEIPDGSATS